MEKTGEIVRYERNEQRFEREKGKGGAAVIERRFDPVASSKSQTNRTKIVILLCWGGVPRRIYVGADISRLLITVRSFKMLLRE
jgi:hypothetical protein